MAEAAALRVCDGLFAEGRGTLTGLVTLVVLAKLILVSGLLGGITLKHKGY